MLRGDEGELEEPCVGDFVASQVARHEQHEESDTQA
jgi:hypothetical protein